MSEIRKCKECWSDFTRYNTIQNKCNKCINKINKQKPLKNYRPIKKISDKRKKRLQWYSEKDLYRDIIIQRQKDNCLECEYCWNIFRIDDAIPASFAHILAKWIYPQYRLFKNNIAVVCPDINTDSCHTKIDYLVSSNKRQIEKDIVDWKIIKFNNYKRLKNG